MTTYKERALVLIDKLHDEHVITTRQKGLLRRAILEFVYFSNEPKKGEWIDHSDETIEFGGTTFTPPLTCSECGKSALNESWWYCPNCGAKMEADIEQ